MAHLGKVTPRQHAECTIRGSFSGLLLTINKIKSKSKIELTNLANTPNIALEEFKTPFFQLVVRLAWRLRSKYIILTKVYFEYLFRDSS